ncbi:MAG: phosphoribosylglycinamide formyltransferase [Prevotella sp.]|nr:phosphoribosylglycinamide formyltransferase [Prevotella sp.]
MTNIAIFVSGTGSNCENIIRYFSGNSDIKTALVLSNKADAFALTRAKQLGIPTEVMTKNEFNDGKSLPDMMERYAIDFIVLAGFLLMVPPFLIERYPRHIINIHPALLPKYGGKGMYGHHIHEAVRANNETETGITIHYVSDVCDGGEIIFQASTPVSPKDTPDDIAANVQRLEQQHFPKIIEDTIKRHAI